MNCYLMIDFGSTFTKLVAVDVESRKIIGTARAFTTIETDIRRGLDSALAELVKLTGKIEYKCKFAASSAGGGLKMVAVGLVPDLTAKAARMAANSAGAKVIKTYSYELSEAEQDEIYKIKPDIVLLCGGTDGGNKEVIVNNAKILGEIDGSFSVVAAGNKSVAAKVYEILSKSKHTVVTGNVMPVFNKLNIMPAKAAICDIFIQRIIVAKGLDKAQQMMDTQIIPTPLAVLEATELLARGYGDMEGLGELMAVDVGGATTDVYSMSDGTPTMPNVIEKGLPEPFAKRTVEGDLGLRYSIQALLEAATAERIAKELRITTGEVNAWVFECIKNPGLVAKSGSIQKEIDDKLAGLAVEIAFNRHAGTLERVYTPLGESFLQEGKDLSGIPYIIGIGGPVINGGNPHNILSHGKLGKKDLGLLKPKEPKLFIDYDYIFASMGLLGKKEPELSIRLMLENIKEA